jgi:hypothetical protein
MVFDWNNEKNNSLKASRGIGFERIVVAIEEGHLLDILEHPNKEKYPSQLMLIVEIDEYISVVPCVAIEEGYFLKTIFRNRKYTDLYLPGKRRSK